ncbi:hypothetical protein ASD60_07130 [Pseudomonas sp. Root562]|nr:hypothetical protein ASD60_07130 [Pseudomonas sp. Root562]
MVLTCEDLVILVLQRQRSILHDPLHNERRRQPLHIRQRRKTLIVEPLKGWQILGNDVKQVIRFTKQPLSIDYLGNSEERCFESLNCLSVTFAKGSKHHGGKVEAQGARIQLRSVTEQYSRLLQRSNSTMAR